MFRHRAGRRLDLRLRGRHDAADKFVLSPVAFPARSVLRRLPPIAIISFHRNAAGLGPQRQAAILRRAASAWKPELGPKGESMDCWQYKNCNREVRNNCPAYPDNGKDCWKVTGTDCGQGHYRKATLAEKIAFCRECDYYEEYAHQY